MCALKIMRQVDVHIEVGDGVLFTATAIPYAYRMTDVLDPHFVDGNVAGVRAVLNVFNDQFGYFRTTHVTHPRSK